MLLFSNQIADELNEFFKGENKSINLRFPVAVPQL
jgi:hypothetical protein